MKILVTGGAGFIGGNFVHFMLKEHPQDDILCVDALTYAGNMETLASVMGNPHFKFIKADIADREAIYNKSLSTLQRRATLTARLRTRPFSCRRT